MAGIDKYIDTVFPGLRDKVRGVKGPIPLSSIMNKGGTDAAMRRSTPDAGEQLMGNVPEKKMRDRSTAGSPPFTDAELKCGYRKMGKGLNRGKK